MLEFASWTDSNISPLSDQSPLSDHEEFLKMIWGVDFFMDHTHKSLSLLYVWYDNKASNDIKIL